MIIPSCRCCRRCCRNLKHNDSFLFTVYHWKNFIYFYKRYSTWNVLELGYLIGKDWRRQGFAREAVSMTERFAAEVLQADSLHAFIHPQNESSIAFIKAIGYEKLELPGEDGVLVWQKNLQKGRI